MMTACDLSAITKPWEVQRQASPVMFSLLLHSQALPRSHVKVNMEIPGNFIYLRTLL